MHTSAGCVELCCPVCGTPVPLRHTDADGVGPHGIWAIDVYATGGAKREMHDDNRFLRWFLRLFKRDPCHDVADPPESVESTPLADAAQRWLEQRH
jgi:hypothetical protein